MAEYRTQAAFVILLLLPLATFAMAYNAHIAPEFTAIFILATLYGTFFVSPSCDLGMSIKLLSFRGIMSLPFKSYAMIFRFTTLSRMMVVGTLTRLFWLAAWVIGAFFAIHYFSHSYSSFQSYVLNYQMYLLYAFVGLAIADCAHVAFD